MQINEFIQLREQDWRRLEEYVKRTRGRTPLSAREVHELGRLYRAVTSDLALARRDYPEQPVTLFLNQLLTRAHSYIYQQDVSDLRQLIAYFTQRVPQVFRQTARFTLAAFLVFIVPALVGFRVASTQPQTAEFFGLEDQRRILASQETWTDIPLSERPYASSFIMTNNIRIAILSFGGGVTFGLFSLYILSMNGLVIGAVMGLAAHYGLGESLLTFVVGHGVIELSVIFISGGAGLYLGWALLNPGLYTRRDALAQAARTVVPLIVISIPLLVVAGLIEGFFSPTATPLLQHAVVGIGTGIVVYSYFFLAGRFSTRPMLDPKRASNPEL